MSKKKVWVSLLAFLGLACISSGVIYASYASADQDGSVSFSEVVFQDNYEFGSELVIPKVAETIGGQKIDAEVRVKYPDGSTYGYKDKFALTQAGLYTVDYLFLSEGEFIKKETKNFVVYENLYSFGTSLSSAEYDSTLAQPGLSVKLAAGDTMTFNTIVDLTGYTSWDDLINFRVYPTTKGQMDFLDFYLTLTDIYDETNVVTILANGVSGGDWLYGKAASAGNKEKGSGYYGTGYFGSFIGTEQYSTMRFSLDMSTKEVYINDTMIIDLDSAIDFEKPWVGFTDGKVKMALTISGNKTSYASFAIRSLAGSDVTKSYITETLQPTIAVDSEDMPEKGCIGGKCKIPSATAYIGSQSYEVSSSVFYNYYDEEKRSNINCSNGYFNFTKEGIYTIEYKSYDKFGNCSVEVLDVYAADDIPQVTLTVNENDAVKEGYRGALISVADYSMEIPDEITAACTVSVEKNGVLSAVTDGKFLAEENGEYTVVYTLTDNVGREQKASYKVNITTSQHAVIGEIPALPEYFLGGYDYAFPAIKAYNYTTNQESVASVRYKIDNGDYKEISVEQATEINCEGATGTLYLEYYVKEGGNVVSSVVFQRPIIKVYSDGKIDMAAYFMTTEGISVSKQEDHYALEASKDGTVRFLKNQAAQDFNFTLALDSKKASYSEITVYLTDSVNKNERVAVRFKNNDNSFFVTIGETGSYLNTYNTNLSFMYSSEKHSFSMNANFYEANKTVYGASFTGFSSGLIDFEIEFAGVETSAVVKLAVFNGQNLNAYIEGDYIAPKIVIPSEIGVRCFVGEQVKISEAFVSDIFDPTVKLLATLTDPNGNVIVSVDGVRLENVDPMNEYYFVASELGVYNVKYSAKGKYDFKARELNIKITAMKATVKPTMTIYGDIVTEAKLGDTIYIPEAKSYDVDGSALTVIRMVITPTLDRIYLSSEYDSFVANRTGTYSVVYYALNSDGEPVSKRFIVEVK